MKNVKIILSDIHLENKPNHQIDFIKTHINKKIAQIKKDAHLPILCLCGDVSQHLQHWDWIKSFDVDTIMTAGNHEFWENDFYDVIKNFKEKNDDKFHFLYRDFCVINGEIFLGATLWTDLGKDLNSSVIPFASGRIRDFEQISATQWYENEENIKRLKKYTQDYQLATFDYLVSHKKWNPLIEIEENEKTFEYFNHFSSSLKLHEWIQKIVIRDEIISNYEKDKAHLKMMYQEKDFLKLFENLKKQSHYHIHDFNFEYLNDENFLKLFKNLYEVNQLPLTVVTHHLPFYEELFIGHHLIHPESLQHIKNDTVFKVRDGIEYHHYDYLQNAARGREERHSDITHIVNYYNYGAKKIPSYLINRINAWYHGHEHHFKHNELIKAIEVVTNPLSPQLAVFDFKSEVKLHPQYMHYHQIGEEEHQKAFDEKINKILTTHETNINKQQLKKIALFKTCQNFDFKNFQELTQKMIVTLHHILDLCFVIYDQNPVLRDNYLSYHKVKDYAQDEKHLNCLSDMYKNSVDTFKKSMVMINHNQDFNILMLDNMKASYQSDLRKFNDILHDFDLLLNLKTNENFNIVHELAIHDTKNIHFNIHHAYMTGWNYSIDDLERFDIFENDLLLRFTLKNKYCLENALKVSQTIEKLFINSQDNKEPTLMQLKSFDKLMDKILNLKIEDKFDKKFVSFYKSYRKIQNM